MRSCNEQFKIQKKKRLFINSKLTSKTLEIKSSVMIKRELKNIDLNLI